MFRELPSSDAIFLNLHRNVLENAAAGMRSLASGKIRL
jgi:hypothetical protein